MKVAMSWICFVCVAFCSGWIRAEQPAGDPVQALLFPPELLIQNREQLGLTDEQFVHILDRVMEMGPMVQEPQARLTKAMGKLAELLAAESVDEAATLKQLDEVLGIEKELKHLHLGLMIRIRNDLTAEQRKTAANLQRHWKSDETEHRLVTKVSRIEKAIQTRAEAGQPPADAVGLMQNFSELMKNGQVREAEALLDKVMAMLGVDPIEKGPNNRSATGPSPKILEKMKQLQRKSQEPPQDENAKLAIQELLQKIGPLLDQQKFDEAEPLIDRVLNILSGKP